MKKSIAVFRARDYGTLSFVEVEPDGRCWADGHDNYVRVTETQEIEFVDLPAADVDAVMRSRLEEEVEKARRYLENAMDRLNSKNVQINRSSENQHIPF